MPSETRRASARLIDAVRGGAIGDLQRILGEEDPWLSFGRAGADSLVGALDSATSGKEEMLFELVSRGLNIACASFEPELEQVARRALADAPQWRRDARDLHINQLGIVVSKAWGLIFAPGDGQTPIFYGGGYDGFHPMALAPALAALDEDLAKLPAAQRARWFRPILSDLVQGKMVRLQSVIDELPEHAAIRCGKGGWV